MICVSLGHIEPEEALGFAGKAEMIELRADLLNISKDEMSALIHAVPHTVFTFRPDHFEEKDRLNWFVFAIGEGVSYIDIEIESHPEFVQKIRSCLMGTYTELIISYHNFQETPNQPELEKILNTCYEMGGDVAKIATKVNTEEDISALFSLYKNPGRKVIIGMGEKGMLTRVAAIPMGAEFTFAAPSKGSSTADGQLTMDELMEIYKILKIR